MEWVHLEPWVEIKTSLGFCKKNSPRNSWAGVALVWYSKRVLFFEGAEGNFNRSTNNRWVLPCSRNILQRIGIEGHQQVIGFLGFVYANIYPKVSLGKRKKSKTRSGEVWTKLNQHKNRCSFSKKKFYSIWIYIHNPADRSKLWDGL